MLWTENGIRYGKDVDLYAGLPTAADMILCSAHERWGRHEGSGVYRLDSFAEDAMG